ncbi:MAG: thioredoxin family protein [Chloroflexi bacterium]|nr:thioredoxin family protein [Chloroflexota bacterium]
MAEIIEVTDATFNLVDENEQAGLLLFTAGGCNQCKALLALLKDKSAVWEDKAKLFVVDLMTGSEIAARYGIMALPSLIIILKGEILHEFRGMPGHAILFNTLKDL